MNRLCLAAPVFDHPPQADEAWAVILTDADGARVELPVCCETFWFPTRQAALDALREGPPIAIYFDARKEALS